jgi:hypothetical protein
MLRQEPLQQQKGLRFQAGSPVCDPVSHNVAIHVKQ